MSWISDISGNLFRVNKTHYYISNNINILGIFLSNKSFIGRTTVVNLIKWI